MVSVEEIDKIITEIISNVSTKCGHTIAEMHETLSKISYDDQFNQLTEKGLLNPLEIEDYNTKRQRLEDLDRYFDEHGTNDLMGGEVSMYEERGRIVDELFQYGRRLLDGYKTELPINLDDFRDKAGQRDEQFQFDSDSRDAVGTKDVFNSMGYQEREQIELQKDTVNVDTSLEMFTDDFGHEMGRYKDKRLLAMDNYFNGDTRHINHTISHDGYLKALDKETRKQVKDIDSLMEESPGLKYNTLLFRGGTFDIHTRVGETISFKGYVSTTFQQNVAKWYNEDKFGANMLYLIHAPKGTKGIVGNDDRFNNGFMEHEYVLPRNTKMRVININYETNVCEVVIE